MTWHDYLNRVIAPEIRLLGIIIVVCLLISTTGVPLAWLIAIGLLAFAAFHIYQNKLLLGWLADKQVSGPPDDLRGIWHEIAMEVHRQNKKHRSSDTKLRQLIAQFRTVSTALPDGIIIIDELQRIEWLNRKAARLLGLKREQDRGSNIINLVRDPSFVRFFNEAKEGENLRLDSPANHQTKLDMRITPYSDKHLIIVQDFTRLHHMEQVRKDFVANVSHELRTPLSVIVGYIETLHDEASPELEAYRPIFWQMKQQSDRMTRLIEDLLILSNLENSTQTNHQTAVAVPDMLEGIRGDAIILSGDKQQHITLDVDKNLGLKGNTRELHGVFSNLVSNAVNYTPELGNIDIRWYRTDTHAIMEVKDDGIGIEPQHINRLTERFYRADKGRSRSTGGTGLGLAIVKHALQRHDARLDIHSTLGVGSTFRCLFPLERCLKTTSIEEAEDSILTP